MRTDPELDRPGLSRSLHPSRIQEVAWLTLGATWLGYLLLRPYGDETALSGAAGIAGDRWVVAHLLGMAGFVALAVALGAAALTQPTRGRLRLALAAGLGAVLVLPYYGAEAFGLRAVAQEAVRRGDATLLELFDTVRYDPIAISVFGVGLLLVIGAGVGLAGSARHRSEGSGRLAALALGAMVATMPVQYFVPDPLRMAHGALMLGACCWFVAIRQSA